MKTISIIIPIYNEEAVLREFHIELTKSLEDIKDYFFEIIYINDGSEDQSIKILTEEAKNDKRVSVISLSRNFGHDAAINAGIDYCHGDAAIIMDGDLQDSPSIIKEFLEKYEDGYDIVNAKRTNRDCDTFKKRTTAKLFYKVISHWSYKIKIVENVNNFRLISRRIIDIVKRLTSKNKVFRFDVPFAGFKTYNIDISRCTRSAGKSHYSLTNMSRLAIDSIVSVSTQPLNLITKLFLVGLGLFLCSALTETILFIVSSTTKLLNISNFSYMAWLIVNIMMFFMLIILFSIAIVAQYIARIHIETQNRPTYIIDEIISGDNK